MLETTQSVTWSEAQQISIEHQQVTEQERIETEEMRAEAHSEVKDLVYSGERFNYEDIEDIMSGYGFEMDGIEDLF